MSPITVQCFPAGSRTGSFISLFEGVLIRDHGPWRGIDDGGVAVAPA